MILPASRAHVPFHGLSVRQSPERYIHHIQVISVTKSVLLNLMYRPKREMTCTRPSGQGGLLFLAHLKRLPEGLVATSSVRDLAPNEFLYHRGDPATAVHVVINGRVRLLCVSSEGKQVPLYVARSGECVSEHCLFAETYCSDVIAEVRSQVRAFPQDALRSTLLEYPKLIAEFMSLQTQRFNRIRLSLELRSLRSARERIRQYLGLASSSSGTVRLDRPLKYIAEDLGLAYETFYRTLGQLVDEGVVIRTARTLHLSEKTDPVQATLPSPISWPKFSGD